jgi:hypothetical protein
MKIKKCLLGFAGSAIATATAFAGGGLFAPISIDSAAVMPKGIRNLRIGGFTTEVGQKYDGTGTVVPTANAFNRSITWNELISSRSDASERGLLKGGLEAEGVDLGSSVGDAQGLVNARVTSTIPVLAYGLSEKVTFGAGLPIVYSSTHVDTGWVANEAFQKRLEQLQGSGYEPKILSFKQALQNVISEKITKYGYKDLVSETRTDIGDLNLGFKEQIFKDEHFAVALAQKIVVPTGRTADIDKVVDLAPGDGHFNFGASAVADFYVAKNWTLTPSAGYLYQLETSQAVRVPRIGTESISPDVDRDVRVKRGDIMSTALAVKYQATELITISPAYSLQYKNPDSYMGGRYQPARYGFLEKDTWQNMHTAQLAITGSTIPLFKKKQFPVPLDATFALAHVFAGRNVGLLNVAVFELAAYF